MSMQPYQPNQPAQSQRPQNVYTITNARPTRPRLRQNAQQPPPPGMSPGARYRLASGINHGAQQVNVPRGIPRVLGNSQFIMLAWIVAMAVIAWDEWSRHHILPRPARLWYTTLVYAILALIGMAGPVLPFANALAAGYTIVLVYQLFTKTGQFTEGANSGGGSGSRPEPA